MWFIQAGLQSELELATAEIDRTAQRLMTLEREKERIKVRPHCSSNSILHRHIVLHDLVKCILLMVSMAMQLRFGNELIVGCASMILTIKSKDHYD